MLLPLAEVYKKKEGITEQLRLDLNKYLAY